MSSQPNRSDDQPYWTSGNAYPTWLALGDSYTIGEGVDASLRWPAQLAHQQQFSAPEYLAETGWTTQNLLKALASAEFASKYDWVSVMIGVNDQYDGLGKQVYRQGLSEIIDFALTRVSHAHRVVVLSIPDYSVTPFAQAREPQRIARELAAFNNTAEEIVWEKHTTYCDITPLSRLAASDLTLLTEDTLHPSGKMYRIWMEKIARDITQTNSL